MHIYSKNSLQIIFFTILFILIAIIKAEHCGCQHKKAKCDESKLELPIRVAQNQSIDFQPQAYLFVFPIKFFKDFLNLTSAYHLHQNLLEHWHLNRWKAPKYYWLEKFTDRSRSLWRTVDFNYLIFLINNNEFNSF